MTTIKSTIKFLQDLSIDLSQRYPEDPKVQEITARVNELTQICLAKIKIRDPVEYLPRYQSILDDLEKKADEQGLDNTRIIAAAKKINEALARKCHEINELQLLEFGKDLDDLIRRLINLDRDVSSKKRAEEEGKKLEQAGILEENRQLRKELEDTKATLRQYKQPFYRWVASGLLEVLKLPLTVFYYLLSCLKKRK